MAVLFTLAACQSGPSEQVAPPVARVGAPPTLATGPTALPADGSLLVADVPHFSVDPESRQMRFVGRVQNRSAQTVEGTVVRWEAIDERGSLLVAFVRPLPPIPAGQTFLYVHGGEPPMVDGVTQIVNLIITDPGRTSTAPPPFLNASEVRLEQIEEGELYRYRVNALVRTGDQPVDRRTLFLTTVLRDGAGAIVGGDFTFPENVPDQIAPRTSFVVTFAMVPAASVANSAEVIAYALAF
jgi:hypothetical protein